MNRITGVSNAGSGAIFVSVTRGPWGWFGQLLGLHTVTTYIGHRRRWFGPDGWLVEDPALIDQLESAYVDWKSR